MILCEMFMFHRLSRRVHDVKLHHIIMLIYIKRKYYGFRFSKNYINVTTTSDIVTMIMLHDLIVINCNQ